MFWQLNAFLWISGFLTIVSCTDCQDKHQVVCYWGSWSVYRNGIGQFLASNINPKLCTNIVYSFIGLDQHLEINSLDPWADLQAGGFKNLTSLKDEYPCLKTTLAIGGWNEGSLKYSIVAASEERRKKFADAVLNIVSFYDFDGFDLDWEYPASRGGLPADKQNFVELVKEIKNKISPWNFRLSVAIPFQPELIDSGYDICEIAKVVDSIRLMAYDDVSAQSGVTGLSAPMSKIEMTVPKLIANGVPSEKIVLGIPAYGRSFELADKKNYSIGAVVKGPGEAGYFTKEPGFLAYHEVLDALDTGMKSVTSDGTKYAYSDVDWITYDDEETVKTKVQYAISNKLGGIMFWSLDLDDFRGRFHSKFPLLHAINKALSRI